MNAPAVLETTITMTSLELVEFINAFRKAQAARAGQEFPSKGFSELQHKHFLEKAPEVLGERCAEFSADLPDSYGRARKGYRLPKREACLMAMSYSYELQAAVYDRMTALEEQSRLALPDFTDPVIAARAWADAQEQKQIAEKQVLALETQVEADRPKVVFSDAVSASHTSILIGDLAKLLRQNGIEIGQNRLFDWLRDNGYLMKHGDSRNMPTQRAMEMGLFEIKERTIVNPDGSIRITKTPKATGKGQIYFVNKFKMKHSA